MNGDLRLFRKRWWGSWAIGATVLLSLCFVIPTVFEPGTASKGMHASGAVACCGLLIAALLCCYAPWSFFWLIRAFALFGFGLGAWYVVDEVRRGRYVADPGENESLLHAIAFVLVWGLPCLWIALMRRPRACPYDEHGKSRPFEIERTFRVVPREPAGDGADVVPTDPKKTVKFDYAGLSSMEVLDPRAPARLRVRLPLDESGVAVWNDWERRLGELGLRCEVIGDEPGRRTFVNALLHSVKDRWTRGRRVAVESSLRSQ